MQFNIINFNVFKYTIFRSHDISTTISLYLTSTKNFTSYLSTLNITFSAPVNTPMGPLDSNPRGIMPQNNIMPQQILGYVSPNLKESSGRLQHRKMGKGSINVVRSS